MGKKTGRSQTEFAVQTGEHHSSRCSSSTISAIWELRIPQKDFGCRCFLVVLNSQPMLDPHSAQDAIVQAYLHSMEPQCLRLDHAFKNCTINMEATGRKKRSREKLIPWEPAVYFRRSPLESKPGCIVHCNRRMHVTVRVDISTERPIARHRHDVAAFSYFGLPKKQTCQHRAKSINLEWL
jgi:hypothetical protein